MKSVKLVEQTADTLPKLLRRNARSSAAQIGMREKDRGIWQSYLAPVLGMCAISRWGWRRPASSAATSSPCSATIAPAC
jgi:hypothetical protein